MIQPENLFQCKILNKYKNLLNLPLIIVKQRKATRKQRKLTNKQRKLAQRYRMITKKWRNKSCKNRMKAENFKSIENQMDFNYQLPL